MQAQILFEVTCETAQIDSHTRHHFKVQFILVIFTSSQLKIQIDR